MISEVKLDTKIKQFLTKYFSDYKPSLDPYEHILTYTKGQIIGIISYSVIYERVEINYIATKYEYRNQGVATKLLNKMLENISDKCNSISLEVEKTNTKAIKLYSKFGFEIKAIRKNYYGNQDGYLMIKEIR